MAGVGDCRAVLCRRGTAIQLTKLHTASEKEERARIVAADGEFVMRCDAPPLRGRGRMYAYVLPAGDVCLHLCVLVLQGL